MDVLPLNFSILRFFGLWRPRGWSSGWKKNLYSAYTVLTIFTIYTFVVSELIGFLTSSGNIDDVANNSLMLLTMLGICYKMAICVYSRNEIFNMTDILTNDVCRPEGPEEVAIKLRFDNRGRRSTLLLVGLSNVAVVTITVTSFVTNPLDRSLPFNAWLPFDHTSLIGFWIAFIHQIVAHGIGANVGGNCDTLFYGLMAQACGQLNILKYRLRALPRSAEDKKWEFSAEIAERQEVRKCVRHHYEIFRYVKMSNDIFSFMIFIQFSISTFVICVCTYTLSKTSFPSAEFIFIILYLMCMMTQIFLLCWNGNEVISESMDVGKAVYEMDWTSLEKSTQKDLRMIMVRTLDPIKYTSGCVITLSLESFNSLIKLSYSVYNLMQQTSSQTSIPEPIVAGRDEDVR